MKITRNYDEDYAPMLWNSMMKITRNYDEEYAQILCFFSIAITRQPCGTNNFFHFLSQLHALYSFGDEKPKNLLRRRTEEPKTFNMIISMITMA